MKKLLLPVGLLFASYMAQAQCEAVATLNESFSNFNVVTSNAFPQNCWTSIAGNFPQSGPGLYTAQAGDPANKFVNFYSFFSANTAAYLISPELSTIDGAHRLSFKSWKVGGGPGGAPGEVPAGNVTIQVGTISDIANAETFVPFGTAVNVAEASATSPYFVIPASTTHKHVALRIIADDTHVAAAIDDIVWEAVPCEAVTELNEDFSDFTVATANAFPQNCWNAIAVGGPMVYTGTRDTPANTFVTMYAGSSAANVNVPSYLITPAISGIDGNHAISFDAWKITRGGQPIAGNSTIQVGTMTDPADATTFVAITESIAVTETLAPHTVTIPASATPQHIVIRFSADAPHNAIGIDNVVWAEANQCVAVSTLDENFNDFTDFPENCWQYIANGTMSYIVGEGTDNRGVGFYSSQTASNTPAYVITPELNSFDGNHTLTFDAKGSAAGVITLQPGYITNTDDTTTFVSVGDIINLTATEAPYSASFPAVTGNAHIAFRFAAPGQHQTASLDNVKWQTTASVVNNAKNVFGMYPNPSADKNVTIVNNTDKEGTVAVYSLAGAKVYETALSGTAQQLNLSALSSGMYIVKFTSGSTAASQKLIIQ